MQNPQITLLHFEVVVAVEWRLMKREREDKKRKRGKEERYFKINS